MNQASTRSVLLSVLALAACGRCEQEQDTPEASTLADETGEALLDPQRAAEQQARAAFFEFELTDVHESFGGDWVAFYENKTAEDRELATSWHWDPSTPLDRRTPADARAQNALKLEHQRVVLQELDAARQVAAGVVAAILAGDVASIAEDCVAYGPSAAGTERCEQQLREQLEAMQRALRGMDSAADNFGGGVGVQEPSPANGQPSTAHISFGPEAEAPEDQTVDDPLYPPVHQIVLIWSGPVMPDPNGPLYSAPQADIPSRGRWRFHSFVFPYSRRMGLLQ